MGNILVIVESPSKAKTINKYLGDNYIVKFSLGHIRDLSNNKLSKKKYDYFKRKIEKKTNSNNFLLNYIGIDPYDNWKAKYEILPGKEKIVSELKELSKTVDHIYLATDLDREGESIAWHLREVIGGNDNHFSRIVFNEITYKAITKSLKKPREININRVNAQKTRRFMDRIVGYMVSPLLWKKISRKLSAGRVQSMAVRLIIEKEREIKSFFPKEYWELYVDLEIDKISKINMKVTHQHKKIFKPTNKEQINIALLELKNSSYIISDYKNKLIYIKPSAPFTTCSLQQTASKHLGFSVKKTMMLAQKLYEMGYVTYIRTDSTNLSQDAITMVRNYISLVFGEHYLSDKINTFPKKSNIQEAHEAIRPSDIRILVNKLKGITNDTKKLYQIIWNQCIASQMRSAQYDENVLTAISGEFKLRSCMRTLIFDGWMKITQNLKNIDKDQYSLLKVNIGQVLTLKKFFPIHNFTKPPSRYNEASLVKKLDKLGIGRPSTYSSIISTIQDRGYVSLTNHCFYAEKIGEIVNDCLEKSFIDLMNYDFTANMENILDQIAANQKEWTQVMDIFFKKFKSQLEIAEKDPHEGGMRPNLIVMTEIDCLVCGKKMGIRTARTGVFLGCSGYTFSSKECCKNTIHLVPQSDLSNISKNNILKVNEFNIRCRCKKCDIVMDSYLINNQKKIHICGNNPLCDGYKIETGEFNIIDYNYPMIECDKCGDMMNFKISRFGKYMICSIKKCNNIRKILYNGDIAPPKIDAIPLPELPCKKSNAYFVLHDGSLGIFLAAHTFPKSRETRSPLVEELVRFKNRLPEKLHYLIHAPIQDDVGNKTMVKFNRKTKQQYITSEKNGKITNWTAVFIKDQWKIYRNNETNND